MNTYWQKIFLNDPTTCSLQKTFYIQTHKQNESKMIENNILCNVAKKAGVVISILAK